MSMRRLTIQAVPVEHSEDAHVAPDGTTYVIASDPSGLGQIADYARQVAAETGDPVVCFEVFWPWETEADQTWDALRVDTTKIDAADPDDWWVETLPPYAEMTAEQRAALGIEGY
jgi:hypothetical protein